MSIAYYAQWDEEELMSMHGVELEEIDAYQNDDHDDIHDDSEDDEQEECCGSCMDCLGLSCNDFM